MILSRILARKRIKAGERPSFLGAWLPVAADSLMITIALILVWQPLLTLIYVMELSFPLTIVALMIAIYGPFQVVTIIATIWAIRSRWEEEDTK